MKKSRPLRQLYFFLGVYPFSSGLNNSPRFHIKPLFLRLPHRERFARQSAIQDDRLEQVGFVHAWNIEPGIARLRAQAADHLLTVYIIDLICSFFFQEDIQACLDRSNR